MVLTVGSFFWAVTQPVTCRSMHANWTWIAVSLKVLWICSSALATSGPWASALSVAPTVTPSRMDFMVSAFSFEVILLRASVPTLSCPFWYSILSMNCPSDSTHQWCVSGQWMVCRGGTLETSLQSPTLVLETHVSLSRNCAQEQLGIGWHMLLDDIDHQPVFVITQPLILTY